MRNPYRCKTCGKLAGKDGYCKNHKEDAIKRCRIESCNEPRYFVESSKRYAELCRKHFYGDEELDLARKNFATNETTPALGFAQQDTPGAFHVKRPWCILLSKTKRRGCFIGRKVFSS